MRFSKIPGEDPSQIAFSPKIGNLHRVIIGNLHGVTICRELRHSDQINKSEHGATDRPFPTTAREPTASGPAENLAACPAWGWGRALRGVTASWRATLKHCVCVALVKVLRPSLRWRQWRSVTICRELRHSDQINKSEHGATDRPFPTTAREPTALRKPHATRPGQAYPCLTNRRCGRGDLHQPT